MRAILIRHGQTAGNLAHRYIGCRTDEPLCEEGRAALSGRTVPDVDRVYCSPMLRCRQTAALLYPGHTPIPVDNLRECDFGAFEGMSYTELNGRADYQAWIDSGGELPFPGGESRAMMEARASAAFDAIAREAGDATCAFIVHGGTIMGIMATHALPVQSYFSYQARNGCGFILEADGSWKAL